MQVRKILSEIVFFYISYDIIHSKSNISNQSEGNVQEKIKKNMYLLF